MLVHQILNFFYKRRAHAILNFVLFFFVAAAPEFVLTNPAVHSSEGLVLQFIVLFILFDFQVSFGQLFLYFLEHLYLLEEDLERVGAVKRTEQQVYVHRADRPLLQSDLVQPNQFNNICLRKLAIEG